jgi:DNA-binding response OmpR family regulator
MRVLFVEDSQTLCQTVGDTLRRSGFAVDICNDGESGLWQACSADYDVLILDILLPKLDGIAVLQRLREARRETPVLMLTAKTDIVDRVKGLNAGADDYLGKPFALAELLARVMALIRRRYGQANANINVGGLLIDRLGRRAQFRQKSIELNAREYGLLEYLASRMGELVTRSEIETHIYDELVEPASNVVDSAICILRRKLADAGAPPMIQTRRGQGYVFDPNPACNPSADN